MSTATWGEVLDRLAPARTYWLVTASAAAVPHAAPVWGVVVDDDLYLYSERSTVKARNFTENPHVVVHLESADDVVIVHGRAEDLGSPEAAPRVVAALEVKYDAPGDAQYLPSTDPAFDVLYVIRPARAMMWRLDDYETSQRRWTPPS
jgi:nitroimidazol reductase NimA-like FMN-containing flavoprotein (pyridoxamine 5'-phosphate oxidase superfamily)